jgi:hypothetical protein
MPVNHVLLETIELNQSTASVTFDNIPQTGYSDLKIVISARGDGASGSFMCQFNGATTNLSSRVLYGINGNATGSSSYSDENSIWGYTTNSGSTANTFNNAEIYIPNYTSSNNKSVSIDAVNETNAADGRQNLTAGLWSSTAAITSITLLSKTGSNAATNFTQYSTFSIYGVAATETTPAIAPKAQGGNIIASDGTYWYHAFLSSGIFTPTVPLTCDALVVAGGGAGGRLQGGGGGAGGLLPFTSQSFSTAQTVTVGAGGGPDTGSGSSGSDSQIGSLTLVKGGGGGAEYVNGTNGGSGGGASGASKTGGSPTSGQGNAGGNSGNDSGGGGGGAGAAGSNGASSTVSGAGGIGSATYSSWGVATGTGHLVSSTRYYAGGGGGGVYVGGTGAAGGSGGGAAGVSTGSPSNALINTGGGGGGGTAGVGGGGSKGGSGIVIIRYTIA